MKNTQYKKYTTAEFVIYGIILAGIIHLLFF